MADKENNIDDFSILKLPIEVRFGFFKDFVIDMDDMLLQEKAQKRDCGVFVTYTNDNTQEKLLVYPFNMVYYNDGKPNFPLLHKVHEMQPLFRREMLKVQSPAYAITLSKNIVRGYAEILERKERAVISALQVISDEDKRTRLRDAFFEEVVKTHEKCTQERIDCGLIEKQQ